MPYSAVIFDLDGTLVDTLADLRNAVNCALREAGLPERSLSEIRSFVGNGVGLLMKRAIGQRQNELFDRLFPVFCSSYEAHLTDCSRPYEGIEELLSALKAKGVKIAVISNKKDAAAKTVCSALLPGLLDLVCGERDGIPRKPDPAALDEIFTYFGEDKTRCLLVGDSEVDLQTARNAGIDSVSVKWGFRSEESLRDAGATRLIGSPEELLTYFA